MIARKPSGVVKVHSHVAGARETGRALEMSRNTSEADGFSRSPLSKKKLPLKSELPKSAEEIWKLGSTAAVCRELRKTPVDSRSHSRRAPELSDAGPTRPSLNRVLPECSRRALEMSRNTSEADGFSSSLLSKKNSHSSLSSARARKKSRNLGAPLPPAVDFQRRP
jgi:hypothetical protein